MPQSGGPYSVMALGSVVLNGSAIDADGDTVRLSWDLDGSGAFATIGGSPTVLAGATTGSRTIVLRACDDQLACATASTTLTVTPAPGGGGGGDGNGGTGGPPSPGDTPELDSLILFGSGLSASIAYILRRRRARTRR